MAALKNIIKIAKSDYDTLVSEGSITKGGVVYTYDPDETIYMVDNGLSEEYVQLGDGSGKELTDFALKTELNDVKNQVYNETSTRKSEFSSLQASINSVQTELDTKTDKAFSNVAVGDTTIAAGSKADTFSFVAGSNITLTPGIVSSERFSVVMTSYGDSKINVAKAIKDNTDLGLVGGKALLDKLDTESSVIIKSGLTGTEADTLSSVLTTAGATTYVTSDSAPGITIAAKDTTYSAATASAEGLMSASDKSKLDGIATGANKTVVDEALSSTSTNPVQNKVINAALNGKADTSHTHTKSQITDFPASMPASDVYAWAKASSKPTYTKSDVGLGNVDNTADADKSVKSAATAGSAGKLTTPRTIAVGTAVSSTPTTFSGEANITIPVNNVYESYLSWGGKGIANNVTPIGAALSAEHSANRLALINGDALTIEYSSDGGSTWTDYGMSTANKSWFCTGNQQLWIGKTDSATLCTLNSRTRVTICGQDGNTAYVYTAPRKLLINCSSSCGMHVLIETKTGAADASWNTFGTYTLSGFSGWNDIPLVLSTFGGSKTQTTNIWYIRLTFIVTSVSASRPGNASILGIRLFGASDWNSASANNGKGVISSTGHLYSYDANANATFPNNVTSNGALMAKGNLYEGGTSSSNLLSNRYAAKSHTHNYAGSTSAGGSANSAVKLENEATIGALDQPVYFTDGQPHPCAYTIDKSVPEDAVFTDTKVTAVGNHYIPAKSTTKSASGGTLTDITNSSSGVNVVTGVEMDAAGHVTGVTSSALKSVNTTYTAGTGISISGTAISNSGVRSVASGSDNGTISVNTNGTTSKVAVTGLKSAAYTESSAYAASGHTHNYAGSSSAGGAATSADKLNTDAGSATKPVYISNGVPVACSHSVEKDVPSTAVFTDTHYTSKMIIASSPTATSAVAVDIDNPYINLVENGVVRSSVQIGGAKHYSDGQLPDIVIDQPSVVTTSANGLMSSTDKAKLDRFKAIDIYDIDVGSGEATTDTATLNLIDELVEHARSAQNGNLVVYDASGTSTSDNKCPAAVIVTSYTSSTFYQITIVIYKGLTVRTIGFFRNGNTVTCVANNTFDLNKLNGTSSVALSNTSFITSGGVWTGVNAPATTVVSSTSYTTTLSSSSNHRIMIVATSGSHTFTLPSSPQNNETFTIHKLWTSTVLTIKSASTNIYNIKGGSTTKVSQLTISGGYISKVTCIYCNSAWYVLQENLGG